MDQLLLAVIFLYCFTNVFGIAANTVLMYAVLTKTPKVLGTYSLLIFNIALTDFLACLSALFVMQRLIPDGLGLYYFSNGPCKFIGPTVCFIGFTFMLDCYVHTNLSLLFSFSYRYYVLFYSSPTRNSVVLIILFISLFSLFTFVTFCFAHDDIAAVRAAVVENLGYNVEGECVTGHLSILHWKTLFTILNTAVTIVPVYAVILLIRRAIVLKVDGLSQNLSRNTRLMHDQLLKALYYQACLPIFFLFGSITYAIAGIVPVLSPLTSLLFIRPYYTWFIRVLKFEKAKPSNDWIIGYIIISSIWLDIWMFREL